MYCKIRIAILNVFRWDTNLKLWSASLDADDTGEPSTKKLRGCGRGILTRVPLHTLKGHKENISSVNWTDNHTVCTASMDHTIKFWDCEVVTFLWLFLMVNKYILFICS